MANVLFVCVHNTGRSQISRALFERAAGRRHAADSAGTEPLPANPEGKPLAAVRALRQEIAARVRQLLDELDSGDGG